MLQQTTASSRGSAQDAQYRFPYHHLPRFENGSFRFHEVLSWGHEYLAYMTHVADRLGSSAWNMLLDVGCGDGRLVSILQERFPDRRVVGLDYSERAISLAAALIPSGEFISGDITKPDLFTEKFDAATCIDVIEHIDPARLSAFVSGIHRHLKPNAPFVATVPSTNLRLNPKHYQHFTKSHFLSVLNDQFFVDELYFINGKSHLLKFIRSVVTNRVFTLTHPMVLNRFYRYYVSNYLRSDEVNGTRLIAICRAR